MFSNQEIRAVVDTVPVGKFAGADTEDCIAWVQYVASIDAPKAKHPVMFYATVARAMAESLGSVHSTDYADEHMRGMTTAALVKGDQPFLADDELDEWKDVKLLPVHIIAALKVVGKAQKDMEHCTSSAVADAAPATLTSAIESYVKSQQAALDKDKKECMLAFDLAQRIQEVGLGELPREALPSEESMIKLQKAGKAAHDKGRKYIGSVDGEDLQVHFRPAWSRTPQLDVLVGDGSLEDKLKGALEARKSRNLQNRVDFPGFATFLGHLLDWGLKMVITKVFEPVHLVSYQYILVWIAEEWGSVRTAYYYDLLQRQEMAKALERGETNLTAYLTKLDRDRLSDAKRKVEMRAQEAGRDTARARGKGQPKGSGKEQKGFKGGKGGKGASDQGARSRSPKAPWAKKGSGFGKGNNDRRPSWEREAANRAAGSSGKNNRSW